MKTVSAAEARRTFKALLDEVSSGHEISVVRRGQEVKKNAGQQGADAFEHQVESADAIASVHEDDSRHDPRKKRGTKKQLSTQNDQPEEPGNLDLTA